jgi:GH24 family phage-related lysozyme (muramidase)
MAQKNDTMKKTILLMAMLLVSFIKIDYSRQYSDPTWYIERLEYQNKYAETVDFIKKHEGFRSTQYKDMNGFKTIGYGFLVRYIPKRFSDSISAKQADSILNQKMTHNISLAKKEYPGLDKYQILAVAHLIYCKGFGKLKKHPLDFQIKNGSVDKNTWVYFSKYEKSTGRSGTVFRKNRLFEYELFNYKDNISQN